jgi:glycosyltransferase involved in cell wall biosynthesis
MAEDLRRDFPDVDFVGHLDPPDVASVLRAARASVVPSVWFENAPMSVLESLAAGIPVIASRIGGIPELVEDGREGLLVPAGDVDALALALGRLDADADLAGRLGAAGRERAVREFSPERHLRGLLRVYEEVVAPRRSA